ncbi:MAG: leucine-rich repeat protein [Muribaculaceae bacterium]|nr:leucine-rich repeat protein [Muribaculaceae bacterium]
MDTRVSYPSDRKTKRGDQTWIISLIIVIIATLPSVSHALKIDDTHYRFCVMDNQVITDMAAQRSKDKGYLSSLGSSHWYSQNGVLIYGKSTEAQGGDTGVNVLMSKPYSGTDYSLRHPWVEMGYSHTTWFYITVDAPSGVVFDNMPSKLLVDDEVNLDVKLTGEYTPFSGGGYFRYDYTSSNPEIISVSKSTNTIKARALGKATVSVEVYALNKTYTDYSYRIGTAKIEIEIVDNMDPTDIVISDRELLMDTGTDTSLKVSLTPEDARTTITWSSSDTQVATVSDGLVKAIGKGNAVIEASTSNGLSAKCYVTVLDDSDYENVLIDNLYYKLDRKNNTAVVVPPAGGDYDPLPDDIVVPESVKYYEKNYTVTAIGANAFDLCAITSVTLPASVSAIGNRSFAGTLIRDIDLPEGLKEIGEFAFSDSKIESIMIGKNVSIIRPGAFSDCEMLRAIYVDSENNNFTVNDECLYNKSLKTIYYIPITKKSVVFSVPLETIGAYACVNNKTVTQLDFPENLRIIGQHAFEGCDGIMNLSFPTSLQEVEDTAFYGCNHLEKVSFGDKIKIIGKDVFTSPRLIKVTVNALTPPNVEESSFVNYEATLLVPKGRVAAYQKHPVWENFKVIIDEENISVSEIILSDEILELLVEEDYTLTTTVAPENATDTSLVWESSDSEVVQVDQNGTVKALAPGIATITVRSVDGGASASCEVTVKQNAGIETISADDDIQILTLTGIRVSDPLDQLSPGIYLIYRGNKVRKIIVR